MFYNITLLDLAEYKWMLNFFGFLCFKIIVCSTSIYTTL